MTLPMTRLAVGPAADPQLPPLFVVAGRAALSGVLSVIYLRVTGASRPAHQNRLPAPPLNGPTTLAVIQPP